MSKSQKSGFFDGLIITAIILFFKGHIRGVNIFKVRDGKVAEKFSYVKG